MNVREAIAEALVRWPESVPLDSARRSTGGRPQAKADGRTSPEQRETLRAAGWEATHGGWWTWYPPGA